MASRPDAILLPGGAGYIGSHVVVELLERTNYTVLVVDNLSNAVGHPVNKDLLPPSLNRVLDVVKQGIKAKQEGELSEEQTNKINARLMFYYREYDDEVLIKKLNKEYNILSTIIVAGYKAVGESKQKPLMYYSNNVCKTTNLLTTGGWRLNSWLSNFLVNFGLKF